MKTAVLTVRLDPEVKAAFEAMAAEAHRSLAGEIESLIVERAKALGKLPADWRPAKRGS